MAKTSAKEYGEILGQVFNPAVKDFLVSKVDSGEVMLTEIMSRMAADFNKTITVGLEENEVLNAAHKANRVAKSQSLGETKATTPEATPTDEGPSNRSFGN